MTDQPGQPDPYALFPRIDCLGGSRHLIEVIRRHISEPEKSNAFWEEFERKLGQVGDTTHYTPDELQLVCAYKVYIEELFETYDDTEGLAMLEKLEETCC